MIFYPMEDPEPLASGFGSRTWALCPWLRPARRVNLFLLLLMAGVCFTVLFAARARADRSLLAEGVVACNMEDQEKSLSERSYRGEEGILRIRPDIARTFGLRVIADKDYEKARDLYEQVDQFFEQALEALVEGDVATLGKAALSYNRSRDTAYRLLMAYRERLDPSKDERLSREVCLGLLNRILEASLRETSYNLRDALARFYNKCQGLEEDLAPLNVENVTFVNRVFNDFVARASPKAKARFDLDKGTRNRVSNPGSAWKRVVDKAGLPYVPLVERVLEARGKEGYPLDPLLFLALIKRESNFDPSAVSYVGAVGLTQIMPNTAEGLGMKQIFKPPYFDKARKLLVQERRLKHRAVSLISQITKENRVAYAKKARGLMKKSLARGRARAKLFSRYRNELLKNNEDDRLDPYKAIAHGFEYLSEMMRLQNGDVSLALASYNAGPHRVRQYKGIPPFQETVTFRNVVLGFYRDYLLRLQAYQAGSKGRQEQLGVRRSGL